MLTILKNYLKKYIDHNQKLPLHDQITNQVLLILSVIAFLSGIVNSLIPFPKWFPYVFYASGFIAFLAVWLNFSIPRYNIAKIIFLITIYPIAIISWLYNSGIHGSAVVFFFTIIIYYVGVFQRNFILFFVINVLVFVTIAVLTYFHPEIIQHNYQSKSDQMLDVFCTYILLGTSVILILHTIIKSYNREKAISETQQKEMRVLYTQLQLKNAELNNTNIELTIAKEKIEENEVKLSSLINNRNESIWSIDTNYCYLLFNDFFKDKYFETFNTDLVIGKNVFDLLPQEFAPLWKEQYDKALKGEKISFEFSHIINERLEYYEVYLNPIFFEQQVTGVSCISVNTTDRKIAEQKLIELNADKDRFISILAHDLKNPFNSLLGFSNLLLENIDHYNIEKIKKQVKHINHAAHKTYNLMDDLLMWAKSESGKIPFEPVNIDIVDLISETLAALKMHADSKNIRINYSEIGVSQVYADCNMLKTILRNLVTNAIKFSNSDGIINISIQKEEEKVLFSVADNGTGISKELQKKLWNNSPHISTTGTSEETGTGLGLILCKEFVEKHHGRIWVDSVPGKGSTFYFTLPENNFNS